MLCLFPYLFQVLLCMIRVFRSILAEYHFLEAQDQEVANLRFLACDIVFIESFFYFYFAFLNSYTIPLQVETAGTIVGLPSSFSIASSTSQVHT